MRFTTALMVAAAMGLASSAPVPARADDTRAPFPDTVAVPLSGAEKRQFALLSEQKRKADAAYEKSLMAWNAAGEAANQAEQAAAANAAALRKKVSAIDKVLNRDIARQGTAHEALRKFQESKRARMPLDVRRSYPRRAASLYLGRHRIGAGGEPLLVHLWTSGRKGQKFDPSDSETSPFHLDVFRGRGRSWRRVSTTVYESNRAPDADDISVRYLRAETKQSPVLIMVGPAYMSTLYQVVTFPGGVATGRPASVQHFSQGGVGGGKSTIDFGVDGRGLMTVRNENVFAGRLQGTTIHAWDGRRFAARPYIPAPK
jgi:hypothetical protein